ncbi:MAG TPA: Fic family protein [Nitrospiraceae bacterium]|nr:Fic family protein [Nitrospiraceae bacterium]
MSPQFLTLDEVMDIHRDQIERHGGTLGVRDAELLESALAAPQSGFGDQYLHGNRAQALSGLLVSVYHRANNGVVE